METLGQFYVSVLLHAFSYLGTQGEGAAAVGHMPRGMFHVFSWQRKGAHERQSVFKAAAQTWRPSHPTGQRKAHGQAQSEWGGKDTPPTGKRKRGKERSE